jgi:hypothetical protein
MVFIYIIRSFLNTDLKRFRSYHGHSVTDLLRALRNKVCFKNYVGCTGLSVVLEELFIYDVSCQRVGCCDTYLPIFCLDSFLLVDLVSVFLCVFPYLILSDYSPYCSMYTVVLCCLESTI